MSYGMGLKGFTPELLLLMEISRGINEFGKSGAPINANDSNEFHIAQSREKVEFFLSRPVDWDLFLKMTWHHRVFPMVYKTLSNLKIQSISPHVMHFLKLKYEENTIRSIGLTGEMIRILRIFQEKGISTLVLKGAPLAQKIYGDVSLRMSKDIDLLVPLKDLEKAENILREEGYEQRTRGISFTPRQTKVYLNKYHHNLYLHQERGTCLELHWKMHQIDLRFSTFSRDKDLGTVEISGFSVPVLPDEEWFLYLVVHGGSHKWERLRWLIDMEKFLLVTEVDWDKIMRLAECAGMKILVHQTFLLLDQLFHVDLPDKILEAAIKDKKAVRLAEEVIDCLISRAKEAPKEIGFSYWKSFIETHGYRFRIRSGWKLKFSYLHSLIQPIERDFKLIALPDPLYPLYYFIRPMTWLKRRIIGDTRRK
ncbi:MAG: nucleotidyltransferase family protein [Bacillota bacterium]